jgi:hypothetical protein
MFITKVKFEYLTTPMNGIKLNFEFEYTLSYQGILNLIIMQRFAFLVSICAICLGCKTVMI